MRPSGLPGQLSVSFGLVVWERVQPGGSGACAHHSVIDRWLEPPQPGWQSGTTTFQVLAAGEHWAATCSQSVIGSLRVLPSGALVPAGNRLAVTFGQVPPDAGAEPVVSPALTPPASARVASAPATSPH